MIVNRISFFQCIPSIRNQILFDDWVILTYRFENERWIIHDWIQIWIIQVILCSITVIQYCLKKGQRTQNRTGTKISQSECQIKPHLYNRTAFVWKCTEIGWWLVEYWTLGLIGTRFSDSPIVLLIPIPVLYRGYIAETTGFKLTLHIDFEHALKTRMLIQIRSDTLQHGSRRDCIWSHLV